MLQEARRMLAPEVERKPLAFSSGRIIKNAAEAIKYAKLIMIKNCSGEG